MSESMRGLLKVLYQMAWADGIISPDEVKALTSVLRQLGFPLSEIVCLLDENLSEPPKDNKPVHLEALFPEKNARMAALQALMTVCFSEGAIQPEQVGYIEGLVIRMGLSASDLELLRQNAMRPHVR